MDVSFEKFVALGPNVYEWEKLHITEGVPLLDSVLWTNLLHINWYYFENFQKEVFCVST